MMITDDLQLLNVLRQIAPRQFFGSNGASYVIAGSIPDELLNEFEALTPPVRYLEIGPTWCLSSGHWVSCKDRLIKKLVTRMRERSLLLGLEGPSADELKEAPTLSSWIAISDVQCGGVILVGMQTGHPTLSGLLINTSRLCGMAFDLTWARTTSRWYKLDERVTPEKLVDRLGAKLVGLKHLMLDPPEILEAVKSDQLDNGVHDV
jgi:hypothetical protein